MSNLKLSAPFGRVGGKSSLKSTIYAMYPKNFNSYIELFVGGGSLFFGYDWEGKKTIINDKDKELIQSYKTLKKGIKGDLKKYDITNLESLNNFAKKHPTSELEKLVKFRIKSNNTFGNKALEGAKIYKTTSPYLLLKKADQYKEKLKNTTILNQDYKSVINKYDNAGAFFYLDPPYEKSDKLYNYDVFNYPELANKLKTIKGKFLLSTNDSKEIRDLFKGFKIRGVSVRGKGNDSIGVGMRKELIISNY